MNIFGFQISIGRNNNAFDERLKRIEKDISGIDLALSGDDLDDAIENYNALLENDCRDTTILTAARDRIYDIKENYECMKLERLQNWVGK